MTISYGALAGLIAAIAFLILVLFTIPMLTRTAKLLKETSTTIQTTNESLKKIFAEIDQLEKTRFHYSTIVSHKDIYYIPLFIAFILLIFEGIIRLAILKQRV